MAALKVTHVRFNPSSDMSARSGALGRVQIVLDGALRVDRFQLRRTATGHIRIQFPESTDKRGVRHAIVWPLAPGARDAIERQILDELTKQGVLP
jgi:hypothetical protein